MMVGNNYDWNNIINTHVQLYFEDGCIHHNSNNIKLSYRNHYFNIIVVKQLCNYIYSSCFNNFILNISPIDNNYNHC